MRKTFYHEVNVSDYYPFGKTIPERAVSKNRYDFNGKETDQESGYQDYGFRDYDVEVCRFIEVDPLHREYPELTTYQFASNTPIMAIDLDGLEAKLMNLDNIQQSQYDLQMLFLKNYSNQSPTIKRILTKVNDAKNLHVYTFEKGAKTTTKSQNFPSSKLTLEQIFSKMFDAMNITIEKDGKSDVILDSKTLNPDNNSIIGVYSLGLLDEFKHAVEPRRNADEKLNEIEEHVDLYKSLQTEIETGIIKKPDENAESKEKVQWLLFKSEVITRAKSHQEKLKDYESKKQLKN